MGEDLNKWKGSLFNIRFTIYFIAIVAVLITITSVLAERGVPVKYYWMHSPSQWWGIFTSHWVHLDFNHYLGNLMILLVFGEWVILFSLFWLDEKASRKFGVRFPLAVLSAAVASIFLMTLLGDTGAGVSAVVSAAFGAGLYVAATHRPVRNFFSIDWLSLIFVLSFYVLVYGFHPNPMSMLAHWAAFLFAIFFIWVANRHLNSGKD